MALGKFDDFVAYLVRKADATLAKVKTNSIIAQMLSKTGVAATYDKSTDSFEAISDKITALTGAIVVGSGTLTTSSATVPADTSQGAKASDYFKGCLLIPLTGVCAYQPRLIVGFTTATGVFTLNSEEPFTAVPGLVTYVIVSFAQPMVPAINGAVNKTTGHVIGGKADTPVFFVDLVSSVIRYLKGILNSTGTVVKGAVTTATSTTQFADLGLAGFGNGHFVGWWVTCTWDAGGVAGAPQGEWRQISAYVSATGLFTHPTFTAQLAVTDKFKIVSPEVFEAMALRGGAVTIQDLLDNQQAMLDLAEYPTISVVCDGNEQTVYEMTGAEVPFFFAGGFIDWTGANAGAGEDTTVRVYVKVDGTNYREIYCEIFLAAAVPDPVATPFPRAINTKPTPEGFYSKQDIKVTVQQAAIGGGWNTLDVRTIDAVRGG